MLTTLIFASLVLLLALILTPLIRKIALRLDVLAHTNHRTVHVRAIPKLGGLVVYFSFLIALVVFAVLESGSPKLLGMALGATCALLLGLVDDIRGLDCYRKLLGQSVAAMVAVGFGYAIDVVVLPSGDVVELGMLSVPATILWIVGIMNAVNLLDGLDGLAAGFSLIAATILSTLAALMGQHEIAVVGALLAAASAGFLKFNFFPATIFLGDAGSLFLGFALACLSIGPFPAISGGMPVLPLIFLFLVPLTDTLLAIVRRTFQGRHPFWADNDHIHHRLLKAGLAHRSAVLIIYGVTGLGGLTGLLLWFDESVTTFTWVILLAVLFVWGLLQIGCFDFLARRVLPGRIRSQLCQLSKQAPKSKTKYE